MQNGYQIVSDGRSVKEIFGSIAKERNFRTFEDRTEHRSEYRKLMMQNEPSQPPVVEAKNMPSAHAAVLYHAGQFLMALAASSQVNPFPVPWQADPLRGKQVDPFPWPWQTDPPDPWRRG
jgi:hypothetical protein